MAKIQIPKRIEALLQESRYLGPIHQLVDRVSEITSDNKLTFFPDYTDHGVDHISRVLETESALVPEDVWSNSTKNSSPRLLNDTDAVIIIGATLLHDIAMHLHPEGFLALIDPASQFIPIPWFDEDQEGHFADRPWNEVWENYSREAKRFNHKDLEQILGAAKDSTWKFDGLPPDSREWDRNHHLIIGEFIRRHHARLAHEIAIYGFPGLSQGNSVDQFPALGTDLGHPLHPLADLIGLTARSHGISLRICKSYIDQNPLYSGTMRPMDSVVIYPMALLRVGDYLQLEQQRAPAVLLQLKCPQSPKSVKEWEKHRAVQQISPSTDPWGKMITINPQTPLDIYLQLEELIGNLQSEIDHSIAVLGETYGTRSDLGLNRLTLTTLRISSNLRNPAFVKRLPYITAHTGFTSDPKILSLLVEPLYGNEPSVGVRELLQNSIDAVRELDIWKKSNPIHPSKPTGSAGDVVIQFEAGLNESWVMRIQDHGIGMTSDTLQNFFLRAGASFRNSATWSKDFVDDKGKPQVLRSGRFGVGAFAVFLLGNAFRLWTRHVTSAGQNGFYIEASPSSNLIEIRKIEHEPVGTTLEVDLSTDAITKLGLKHPQREIIVGRRCAWYCLDWPKVVVQIVEKGVVQPTETHNPSLKIREGKSHISWSNIHPEGFDSIYWTYLEKDALSCNGIKIKQPDPKPIEVLYDWPEFTLSHRPSIAVFDSASNLALTVQRYGLARRKLPFEEQLARDVALSILAHALVKGPRVPLTSASATSKFDHHPLSPVNFSAEQLRRGLRRDQFNYGLLRWCSNMEGFTFLDPSLINLFESDKLLFFGVFFEGRPQPWESRTLYPDDSQYGTGPAVCWDLWVDSQVRKDLTLSKVVSFLTVLASTGPSPLIGNFKSSEIIYSGFEKDPKHPEVRISKFRSDPGVEFTLLSNNTKEANTSLRSIAEAFAASTASNLKTNLGCYVAEISFEGSYSGGESTLASLWREILGGSIIPFDPELRRNLIHSVRSHAELDRHIRIWESE